MQAFSFTHYPNETTSPDSNSWTLWLLALGEGVSERRLASDIFTTSLSWRNKHANIWRGGGLVRGCASSSRGRSSCCATTKRSAKLHLPFKEREEPPPYYKAMNLIGRPSEGRLFSARHLRVVDFDVFCNDLRNSNNGILGYCLNA